MIQKPSKAAGTVVYPFQVKSCSRQVAPTLEQSFDGHLQTKLNLCCALETLADSLHIGANLARGPDLLHSTSTLLRRAHSFEEQRAFPELRRTYPQDRRLLDTLTRLEGEHFEDRGYADELQEAFTEFLSTDPDAHANEFGYMLRGFFSTLRRHIAFEREHIVPKLRGLGRTHDAGDRT